MTSRRSTSPAAPTAALRPSAELVRSRPGRLHELGDQDRQSSVATSGTASCSQAGGLTLDRDRARGRLLASRRSLGPHRARGPLLLLAGGIGVDSGRRLGDYPRIRLACLDVQGVTGATSELCGGPVMARDSSATTEDVLSALAQGDLDAGEAAKRLRSGNLDAMDLLTALISGGAQHERLRRELMVHVDARHFRSANDKAPKLKGKQRHQHQVPHLPVLMNGTLYDPQDITRFNGTELHFMTAGDHLVAFDDRAVVAAYWESTFLAASARSLSGLGMLTWGDSDYHGNGRGDPDGWPPYPYPSFCEVHPEQCGSRGYGRPGYPSGSSGRSPSSGGGGGGGFKVAPHTVWTEHTNGEGQQISAPANRGFADLTQIRCGAWAWLGIGGSWNDEISSVLMYRVHMCTLYEDIYWGGSTLTIRSTSDFHTQNLPELGWNDRASSVESW